MKILFFFLLGFMPQLAEAKFLQPLAVEPIVHAGVRYVIPHDNGLKATLEAWNVETGEKIWTKTVFRRYYIPMVMGTACMNYDFVNSMVRTDERLILTSVRGRKYEVNLTTKKVHRI